MSLISSSIPNLINGVSQQPYLLRQPTQAALQENCLSSVVDGLRKRSPTKHIAKISSGDLSDTYLHLINRDAAEKYSVVFSSGDISVFDLAGVAKTVNFEALTDNHLDAIVATATSDSQRLYLPSSVTTITLTTTGITTATVIWEKSSTGAFAGEETTVRTDTADTDATVAWTSGDYIRARCSAYTSGTISADVTSRNTNYIVNDLPVANFKALTVADYTFILNTAVVPAMDAEVTPTRDNEALINIKVGEYGRVYQIAIVPTVGSGTTVTYTAPDGGSAAHSLQIDTVYIATQLKTALDGSAIAADITTTRYGNTLHIKWNDGREFALATEDGVGGKGVIGIKKQIADYTDLPVEGPNGYFCEVTGDDDNAFDSFYVKFVKDNDADSKGFWEETINEGIEYKLNAATVPHILVSEADGTFSYKRQTWVDRIVGDLESSPDPSFIGSPINDIFFYKNRFGILADENLIMSKAGGFFQFFPDTVTTILDSGPIDVATTHTKVSILRHAIPFNENLLLFSSQSQFVLKGGDLLTPKTVAINQTTEFDTSLTTKPEGLGRYVYFATDKTKYTAIREYFVEDTTDVNDADDVTAHVPKYIPTNSKRIISSDPENCIAVLTANETNAIYFYNFYWDGQKKVQASWSKWTLGAADNILNADFIGSTMYLIVQRSDGVYFESLEVGLGDTETDSQFLYNLDRKIYETSFTSITYDAGTDTTTWTMPYEEAGDLLMVVRAGNTDQGLVEGTTLQVTKASATTLTKSGDYTATKVALGVKYVSRYRFSVMSIRDANGVANGSGTLTINDMYVFFDTTGYFKVEVTPDFGDTYTYEFTGRVVGGGNNVLGGIALETGRFQFPIASTNANVTIDLVSDSYLPASFQAAEWDGEYVLLSRRV